MIIVEYKDIILKICNLLDEAEEIMLELEKEINFLFECNPDEVEECSENIEHYKLITDEIFEEINEYCNKDETGMIRKAVSPKCDRYEITDDLECIFEKRQQVNAAVFRISDVIPMVENRLKKAMDRTIEKIKENNTSQIAQASRFYNSFEDDKEAARFSQKIRTI